MAQPADTQNTTKCNECDQVFISSTNLREHQKSRHQGSKTSKIQAQDIDSPSVLPPVSK